MVPGGLRGRAIKAPTRNIVFFWLEPHFIFPSHLRPIIFGSILFCGWVQSILSPEAYPFSLYSYLLTLAPFSGAVKTGGSSNRIFFEGNHILFLPLTGGLSRVGGTTLYRSLLVGTTFYFLLSPEAYRFFVEPHFIPSDT